MERMTIFWAVLMLASSASAVQIEYLVRDYNTLQPIENALINISGNGSYGMLTDAAGIAIFQINASEAANLSIVRSGYDSLGPVSRNYTNATSESIYLNPSSTAGIIRIRFVDHTLSEHAYCIYFTENGRLQGCYRMNDTVTLHNNLAYDMKPLVTKTDLLGSPQNMSGYIFIFLMPLIGGGFLAVMILLFAGIAWRMFGGKR